MKNKNFVKITIRCQSAEEMQKAKEAVLYHLETLNPEFEANGSTLTVTVPPLDPKLFFPEEACSIKRRERRNKNVFFLSPKNFSEARKKGWGRLTACIAGHAIQRKNPEDFSSRF